MKKIYLLILFMVVLLQVSYAQQGKDGAKILAVNNATVNEYTFLTVDAALGNTSIIVNDNTLNAHGRFTSSLSRGDLLMIMQVQGATIKNTNDSTWGEVTNYYGAGTYEFVQVSGTSGTTAINVCPLKNNYSQLGKVQVVRVPRYTSLTINSGDTLICDPWDGAQGGVVAVEVSGNSVINGAVNAGTFGFRGGQVVNEPSGPDSSTIFTSTNSGGTYAYGAQKGESIVGYQADYNAYGGMYCRAAPANGGGGGNVWDAAGGGGANAGDINAWTGNGNPDATYAVEWDLEYAGFSSSTSSGGGRGGYATAAYDLGPTGPSTYGPDNSIWSYGYYRENVGGKGGRPLDYSFGRLFMGGGGGAGHEDNSNEASGGNGGGIIYILSYGTVSGNGSVLSNGQHGANDNSMAAGAPANDGDGTGGGGAGGTIVVNSIGAISSISLFANGADGGSQYIENTSESEGAGGGGGGGYIATSNGGLTTQVKGGINGTTNSVAMVSFPPDGATLGGDGIATTISNNFCGLQQLSAITGSIVVCPNKTYTYSVTANCGYPSYTWTVPKGWTGSGTTNSITVTTPANLLTPDTIWVANCPLDTFIVITAGNAPVNPNFPPDTLICGAVNFQLSARSNTFNYLWSTGETTPVISITDTGLYKVWVYSGCDTVKDSIDIVQEHMPKVFIGNDTVYCDIFSRVLDAGDSVTSYKWSTGATTQTITVTNDGTYWVTVANDCGKATDSIVITGCEGDYVVPNAFSPGTNGINNLLGLIKSGNGQATLEYFNIYNRWGQLIFSTHDENTSWDGRFNGVIEPVGVYVYIVKYLDSFGVEKLLKGNITLLR